MDKVEHIFTDALDHPSKRGAKPQTYERVQKDGMIIEKHVPIPLGTGHRAFADVYRPADESKKAAPLIAWTPYGKHGGVNIFQVFPNCGIESSWISDYTPFEAPDPIYWTKHGYAVVVIDIPGSWMGEGPATFTSGKEEAQCFYDAIEYVAALSWSSGKVGLSGVSYLAVLQWHVAALRPPSLGAICPDEGWSDFYREVVRQGGIPCTSFFEYICNRWNCSVNKVENLLLESEAHPFFDEFWDTKKAKLEQIEVPALVIASFADQGLHTRGTFEGFKKISSEEKWLIAHRRKKWAFYYTPEIVEKQRAFFDKFLKGHQDTQVEKWPRVLLEVGNRFYDGKWREEVSWPLERQIFTPYFLDAATESLTLTAPNKASNVEYHSLGGGPENIRAMFDMSFDKEVEITGHISATLFMETLTGTDMDIFVAIYKLDAQNKLVPQTIWAVFEDGPVCLGWLRASHRELSTTLSRPEQPVLLHKRELKLESGRVYELNIELLVSSMVYHPGEKLRFIVQGTDIYRQQNRSDAPKLLTRHEREQVNTGYHRLWTGGKHSSHILVPVIPRI